MPYKCIKKQRKFQRLWKRKQREVMRDKALQMLGDKCVHCGNTDRRVFQVDHIEPIRRKDKSKNSLTMGDHLRRQIVTGKVDINTVQILCANCHQIKTYEERLKYGWIYK